MRKNDSSLSSRKYDCKCTKISIDFNQAKLKQARNSQKYPHLFPISTTTTRLQVQSTKNRNDNIDEMIEIKTPRIATNLNSCHNDTNKNGERDITIDRRAAAMSELKNKICLNSIKHEMRDNVDIIRSRMLNAYGRMGIVEPKLFAIG